MLPLPATSSLIMTIPQVPSPINNSVIVDTSQQYYFIDHETNNTKDNNIRKWHSDINSSHEHQQRLVRHRRSLLEKRSVLRNYIPAVAGNSNNNNDRNSYYYGSYPAASGGGYHSSGGHGGGHGHQLSKCSYCCCGGQNNKEDLLLLGLLALAALAAAAAALINTLNNNGRSLASRRTTRDIHQHQLGNNNRTLIGMNHLLNSIIPIIILSFIILYCYTQNQTYT
jgi:hypothetical protein